MPQQYPVIGPFQGHVDSIPPPHNPANSFDEIRNWLCRKGRFHTRPRLNASIAPPDNAVVRNLVTYYDVTNNLHTLVVTTQNVYAVTPGPTYHLLSYPGGLTSLAGTGLPYYPIVANGKAYLSNGSATLLYADGEASLKDANAAAAFRFLTINAQHLIGAFTTQPEPLTSGSRNYMQRIKWSKTGDPTNWSALGSGTNDLIDVPDFITGLATLGRNTLIWRTNGISLMSPTSDAIAPFRFDNMSASLKGLGTKYPYTLQAYDDQAAWVGPNDIYTIGSGLSRQAIGGKAKKKIFSQLEQLSGDVPQAFIIDQLGPGIDFLSYWLSIPPNSVWVYNYDEDNWQEFASAGGRLTCLSSGVFN